MPALVVYGRLYVDSHDRNRLDIQQAYASMSRLVADASGSVAIRQKGGPMNRCFALASLLVLSGCVSESGVDPDETDGAVEVAKSGILNGYTPSGPDSLAKTVVKLKVWDWDDELPEICSGTLVTTGWLLTAAHCIKETTTDIDIFGYDGTWTWANQWYRHPEAAPDGVLQVGYVDVAMVQLGEEVGPYSAGLSASPTVYVGQSLRCYGYGYYATNGAGLGTLRWSSEALASTRGDPIPGDLAFDYRRYKININPQNQIQAPGDSGGPCFDLWTSTQTGIQSTVATNYSVAEQVKFNYVRQWVIDTIASH